MGPILPGGASPPRRGVSSKARVWLLVGMDSIVKPRGQPALVRRAGGWEKPCPGTALIWGGCPPCSQPHFADKEPREQRKSLIVRGDGVWPWPVLRDNPEFAPTLGLAQNFK